MKWSPAFCFASGVESDTVYKRLAHLIMFYLLRGIFFGTFVV